MQSIRAACGLLLALLPTIAAAGPDRPDPLIQSLLATVRPADEAASASFPGALVANGDRKGVLQFTVVINKVTPLQFPMRALVEAATISSGANGGLFLEFRGGDVQFHGALGKVTISLPFEWHGVNVTTGVVGWAVELDEGSCGNGGIFPCARSVYRSGAPFPMPADGATTKINLTVTE